MRFSTASGSEYEIVDHPAGQMVRRTNTSAGKRADGVWIKLFNSPDIEVGERAVLVVQSLSEFGYDDIGTPEELATAFTTRTTSIVTEVFE